MTAGAAALLVPQREYEILLVDDDDFIAVSLRQYLTARGCHVQVATDRAAAEKCLSGQDYDLILVDPYLTGQAGGDSDQFLQLFRSSQPSAALVVISAYTSPQLVSNLDAHQVVALLTKPQSVVFLSQLVISALKSRTKSNEESSSS